MEIRVHPDGRLEWNGRSVRCALGRGGLSADKGEGDGATPTGTLPLRRVMYRADKGPPPRTALPLAPITRDDGWCDDPADPAYNHPVRLPYPGRHEALWRDDDVYDIVVVLGYNDDPVVAGRGSAVFMHVARPGYLPTEGCVALDAADLRALLAECGASCHLRVGAE